MAVSTRRGGTYLYNHESFGRMMVSEQLRKPLQAVSALIRLQAKANTEASSSNINALKEREKMTADNQRRDEAEGKRLAESYEVERGPIVVVYADGHPGPRITERVVNRKRYAAAREFGRGGWQGGKGTRDLRRAGERFGDLAGDPR